jgi:hypothetical protein
VSLIDLLRHFTHEINQKQYECNSALGQKQPISSLAAQRLLSARSGRSNINNERLLWVIRTKKTPHKGAFLFVVVMGGIDSGRPGPSPFGGTYQLHAKQKKPPLGAFVCLVVMGGIEPPTCGL